MVIKYHVNPNTGKTAVCRATKKPCKYGGESGIENHYSTKEAAQVAYEKSMADHSIKTLHKDRNNYIPLDDPIVQNLAQNLVNNYKDAYGEFDLPQQPSSWIEYDDDGNEIEVKEPADIGDLKYIASGLSNNVYYHEILNKVFKIPKWESVGEMWGESASYLVNDLANMEYETYQDIDVDYLDSLNMEYVPTKLFKVNDPDNNLPVPVFAQDFLSEDDYDAYELPKDLQKEITTRTGLSDFHTGNVWVNRHTGRIVLLDCL